jgi:anti-anti-sigma factor
MTEPGTMIAPGLTLEIRATGGATTVELRGELDNAAASALRNLLIGMLEPGSGGVVIDLSAVTFCDASGLAVLVGSERRARRSGTFLHLAAASVPVDEALEATGLGRFLTVFPTAAAALGAGLAMQHGPAS